MGFGGSGNVGSIAGSSDVALNNPTNANVLSYDSTTSKWKNAVPSAGGVTSVAGKSGVVALDKADVGLGNVDNTSDIAKPISSLTQNALNLKAPLASPVLTGTPTAPTPSAGANTTQLATTAFVTAAIAAAVSTIATSSPVYVIYYDSTSSTWKGYNGGTIPSTAPAGVLIRLVDKRGTNVADYNGAKWDGVSDWMPVATG